MCYTTGFRFAWRFDTTNFPKNRKLSKSSHGRPLVIFWNWKKKPKINWNLIFYIVNTCFRFQNIFQRSFVTRFWWFLIFLESVWFLLSPKHEFGTIAHRGTIASTIKHELYFFSSSGRKGGVLTIPRRPHEISCPSSAPKNNHFLRGGCEGRDRPSAPW